MAAARKQTEPAPVPSNKPARRPGRPKIGAAFKLALDDDRYAKVKAHADATGITMAAVLRGLIDTEL